MTDTNDAGQRFLTRFFELRMIIAVLFTVYGVVCIIWGAAFTTQAELQKAAGINVNLLSGIGMLVLGIAFGAWALLRPIQQDARTDSATTEGHTQHSN